MNIRFQFVAVGPWCRDVHCATPLNIPGNDSKIENVDLSEGYMNGHIIKKVNPDKAILVDQCWGMHHVKELADDCRFFITPRIDDDIIRNSIKSLLERKIIVVIDCQSKYLKFHSLPLLAQLQRTFYRENGYTLINQKFSSDKISPYNMALAGFRFVGNESEDKVECYRCHTLIHQWRSDDSPNVEHNKFSTSKSCFLFDSHYIKNLPVLISVSSGEDITGKRYIVNMPKGQDDFAGEYCNQAILILPQHKVLPEVGPLEMKSVLEDIEKENLNKYISSECKKGIVSEKLTQAVKKNFYIVHFRDLHRELKKSCSAYFQCRNKIKEMDEVIKAQLVSIVEAIGVEKFRENHLDPVIDLYCKKYIVEQFVLKQNLLPAEEVRTGAIDALNLESDRLKKEFNKQAIQLGDRYFICETLDCLIKDGTLGSIFLNNAYDTKAADYQWWKQHEAEFTELRTLGTDLNGILVDISNKIHELLEYKDNLPIKPDVSSVESEDPSLDKMIEDHSLGAIKTEDGEEVDHKETITNL